MSQAALHDRASRPPIRTCVGCRTAVPQAELVRIAQVDGRAVADPRRRMPGRGAYVHARPACVAAAGKGGLARSLRRNVTRAELDGLARDLRAAGGGADSGTPGGSPQQPDIISSGQAGADAVEIGSPSSTRTMSNPGPTSPTTGTTGTTGNRGNAIAPIASDAGAERSRAIDSVEVSSTVGPTAESITEH